MNTEISFDLSPNEFTDKSDVIALFERDYEPHNYLSLQKERIEKKNMIPD